MDIDKAYREALARVNEQIANDVKKAKKEIRKNFQVAWGPPRDFGVIIHNREEFYRLVNWLDKNVGKGSHFWTVGPSVLKYVDPKRKAYNPPKVCNWTIFVASVDVSQAPIKMGPPVKY